MSFQLEQLDDLVTVRVHMDGAKLKNVSFLGFTPYDRVAYPSKHVDGTPQSRPETSEYHCYGVNVLHRNTLPSTVVTLDTSTICSLKEKDHASFSDELESNWPTLLHPESRKQT